MTIDLRYCIPNVTGRGAGLGNELVPWCRSLLAAQVLVSRQAPLARIGAMAVVALVVMMAVQYIPTETNRSGGPTWASAIAAAQSSCESSVSATHQFVVTAPHTKTALWTFPISCKRLTK